MRKTRLIITLTVLALLFFICAQSQTVKLSGKVIDSTTSKPIADASVYVANTTIGTKTDKDGGYEFPNLSPGGHQLLISCVGYKTKSVDAMRNGNEKPVTILLSPRLIQLKEVTINDSWQRNLNKFKQEFIGTTNSKDCKIINPDILNMSFDNNRLSANTDDFLDIENSVLGYKLRFLVKDFWADYNSGRVHYSGTVIFEPLMGSKSNLKKWTNNRAEAYNGSLRHFLVSLCSGNIKKNYLVKKMFRSPNPQWQLDSVRQVQNKQEGAIKIENGRVMRTFYATHPKLLTTFEEKPLSEDYYFSTTGQPGIFKLQFPHYLYIIYRGKTVRTDNDDLYRQYVAFNYQISAISLKDPAKPVLFNSNGDLLTREALLYEGAWDERIVNMLPNDYTPEK